MKNEISRVSSAADVVLEEEASMFLILKEDVMSFFVISQKRGVW